MVTYGILRHRDPEDNFIIASDTYKTLTQATIPTFLRYAKRFGYFNKGEMSFKTGWGATAYCRSSTDPDSVEGIPNVRRVWLDEGGKVTRYFFENLMGRAARTESPIDITTTPYSMNWLGTMVKEAKAGKRDDVGIVHCKSIESPYFSKAEYERQRHLLDPRRFRMKYEGQFGEMEGLVYDRLNLCKTMPLPPGTQYFAGIDWGYSPDPFCLVVRAVTPDGLQYRVFEYYKTLLTISDVVRFVKSCHQLYHFKMAVCDPSQPAHIMELSRAGIPAIGANNEIRYGIDVHYELIKSEVYWIWEDVNPLGLDEYKSYHYPEAKELPLEQSRAKRDTKPVDQNNHGLDAERYLSVYLKDHGTDRRSPVPERDHSQAPRDLAQRLAWLKRQHKAEDAA